MPPHGAGAPARYAREQGAGLIFIPDKLEWIDELSSVLAGSTKERGTFGEPLVQDALDVLITRPAIADTGCP